MGFSLLDDGLGARGPPVAGSDYFLQFDTPEFQEEFSRVWKARMAKSLANAAKRDPISGQLVTSVDWDEPGYCYLRLFSVALQSFMKRKFGASPLVSDLLTVSEHIGAGFLRPVSAGFWHVISSREVGSVSWEEFEWGVLRDNPEVLLARVGAPEQPREDDSDGRSSQSSSVKAAPQGIYSVEEGEPFIVTSPPLEDLSNPDVVAAREEFLRSEAEWKRAGEEDECLPLVVYDLRQTPFVDHVFLREGMGVAGQRGVVGFQPFSFKVEDCGLVRVPPRVWLRVAGATVFTGPTGAVLCFRHRTRFKVSFGSAKRAVFVQPLDDGRWSDWLGQPWVHGDYSEWWHIADVMSVKVLLYRSQGFAPYLPVTPGAIGGLRTVMTRVNRFSLVFEQLSYLHAELPMRVDLGPGFPVEMREGASVMFAIGSDDRGRRGYAVNVHPAGSGLLYRVMESQRIMERWVTFCGVPARIIRYPRDRSDESQFRPGWIGDVAEPSGCG